MSFRWSIVFYGANFAPQFTRGMWAMIAVSIAMAIWTALLVWMHVRTENRRPMEEAVTEYAEKGDAIAGLDDKTPRVAGVNEKV